LVLRLGIKGSMSFQDVIEAVRTEERLAEEHEIRCCYVSRWICLFDRADCPTNRLFQTKRFS
jgi:hypothetical protein